MEAVRTTRRPRAGAILPDVDRPHVLRDVAATWREQGVSCLAAGLEAPGRPAETIGLGRRGPGLGVPGSGTVFEVASVTKLFTALCLAVLAGRGAVALDDPVELPGGTRTSLADLALHTSGLPRRQSGRLRRVRHPRRPPWGLSDREVQRRLRRVGRGPAGRFAYSNLGYGLLGLELGRRSGVAYPRLVADLVCEPLGLTRTAIGPPASDDRAIAIRNGRALPPWGNGVLAAAGDLRSCVCDLLRFGRLWCGDGPDELVAAAALMRTRRVSTGQGFEQELGWRVSHGGEERERLWHGGGSRGFRSGIWVLPARSAVFCALTSTARNRRTAFDPLFDLTADAALGQNTGVSR